MEEVLPAVQKNGEGLSAVIGAHGAARRQGGPGRVPQKKYKIRVKGEPDPEEDEGAGGGATQSVLA